MTRTEPEIPVPPRSARATPPSRLRAFLPGRCLLASAGVHGGLLASLALLGGLSGESGRPSEREARVEMARAEPRLELESAVEPAPAVESTEPSVDERELVARELPPDPHPVPAEPLPEERFELVDPLRRIAPDAWAAPRRPDAPAPAEPAPATEAGSIAESAPPPAAPPSSAGAAGAREPEVLEGPDPVYPRAARRLGLEGAVELRALVRRDGSVSEVAVLATSGHAILDEAARSKLLEWRFRPSREGDPDPRSYLKTFRFVLPR